MALEKTKKTAKKIREDLSQSRDETVLQAKLKVGGDIREKLYGDKLITYAIPCYNSADYMARCIHSILSCCEEDIEIVIVDDGSSDDTLSKARFFALTYPKMIRVIHQENGGHGAAVMTALKAARGTYFKVVDSDDWVDTQANIKMIQTLRKFEEEPLDLLIVNYVYEHMADDRQEVMKYTNVLPEKKLFSWEDIKSFSVSQYLLMHSIVYRTKVLRDSGLELPRHTFYVDNIFAYVPLPCCKRLYYLNVPLYRYFIGRDDQSVNEKVMISRIDQQLKITSIMIDSFHLYEDVESDKLRNYMMSYLTMMLIICSVFSMMSDREDKKELREQQWNHLKEYDPKAYDKVRNSFLGNLIHLRGKTGDALIKGGYKLAREVFKFN